MNNDLIFEIVIKVGNSLITKHRQFSDSRDNSMHGLGWYCTFESS